MKCDAYGHGCEGCAGRSRKEPAGPVTSTDEGVGPRSRNRAESYTRRRLRSEEEDALRYGRLDGSSDRRRGGRRQPHPVLTPRASCRAPQARHGMTRLACRFPTSTLPSASRTSCGQLEGVFSHLASAEVLDSADALRRAGTQSGAAYAGGHGLIPPIRHLANSSAMLGRPESWYNFVRPGMAIYGYELPLIHRDGKATQGYEPLGPRPALSWKTRVLSIRNVAAGQALGYNATYVTKAPARVAVIAAGYGDGLYRKLSPGGYALLRGQRAPFVGRISMDLTIVDVSRISGSEIGDEVVDRSQWQ